MKPSIITRIGAITGLFVGAFALAAVAASWSVPTDSPPGGNVSAPINVGLSEQIKLGALQLNTDTGAPATYGLKVWGITQLAGGLVIETRSADPTANLDTGRMWLITP